MGRGGALALVDAVEEVDGAHELALVGAVLVAQLRQDLERRPGAAQTPLRAPPQLLAALVHRDREQRGLRAARTGELGTLGVWARTHARLMRISRRQGCARLARVPGLLVT